MAKREITNVDFRDLVTIVPGSTPVKYWSSKRPAHDPNQGKQGIREVCSEQGVTLALFISYEAGTVAQEIEVPAANIGGIVRRAIKDETPLERPAAKAGAK